MSTLMIFNNQPYDGSDKTYNALRLAKTLHQKGEKIKIFLMSDSVDLARESTIKPEAYDTDLVKMLKDLYEDGVDLGVCGTCQARCGINKNQPYFSEKIKGTMEQLTNWTIEANKVLTF